LSTPAKTPTEPKSLLVHGSSKLPSVEVDSYSLELEDEEGFVGDQANKGAFVAILDELRKLLREAGEDPLGRKPSTEISRKKLAELLVNGDPQQVALVQSAVERFAQQLQAVIRRFLRHKSWQGTECIVVGGGLSGSRVGQFAIARANIILKEERVPTDLKLLRGDPDAAGLIGSAHLLPSWMLDGYGAMLAVDIGGTHIRAGIIELNLAKAKDLSKARVLEFRHWCHRDEADIKRDEAVEQLLKMLDELLSTAKKTDLQLAPVVGVGCPGVIREDGSIVNGAQNLPGNWQSSRFNLPQLIRERISHIGKHESVVVMHNDAVIQGLSQLPQMRDRKHWGILTIGTGLGNARFSRRGKPEKQEPDDKR
jgi:ROK family